MKQRKGGISKDQILYGLPLPPSDSCKRKNKEKTRHKRYGKCFCKIMTSWKIGNKTEPSEGTDIILALLFPFIFHEGLLFY